MCHFFVKSIEGGGYPFRPGFREMAQRSAGPPGISDIHTGSTSQKYTQT